MPSVWPEIAALRVESPEMRVVLHTRGRSINEIWRKVGSNEE